MSRRVRSYYQPDPAPGWRGYLTLAAVWGGALLLCLFTAITR